MTDGLLRSLWIQIPLLLASAFTLERSADVFLDSIKSLSSHLNIDEALIALLTAGAEWEELAVILSSISTGHQDLAYSNLIGSCIANILGGLGLGLIFLPSGLGYDFSTKVYTAVQLVISIIALAVLYRFEFLDNRLCAGLFFGIFVLYVLSTLRLIWNGQVDAPEDSDDSDTDSSTDGAEEDDPSATRPTDETSALLNHRERGTSKKRIARLVITLVVAAGVLSLSSYLITTSLTILCEKIGLTESTAGLTVLSFITTIPDKAIALKAGRRARAGVLLASTAGSNIFLLTLCLGVVFLFPSATQLNIKVQELGITMASSIALTIIVFLLAGSTRWVGCILLSCYCVFLVFEVMDGPK